MTQQLLAHNATVYLAARNAQKADEAIAELKSETGKQAIFLKLDLSDIPAVRRSAQEFLSCVFLSVFFCRPFSSRLMLSFLGMRVNYTSLSTMRESRVVIGGRCGFHAATNSRGTGTRVNSGIMAPPKEKVTAQQYDLQFGTNVIGTCLSFLEG